MSRRSIGILALILLLPALLHAQERAVLVPALAYELGVPLFVNRSVDIVNYFGADGFGTAYDHRLRFGAELGLPDLFAPRVGLALRLDLGGSLGSFHSFPFTTVDLPADQLFRIDVAALTVGSEIRATLVPLDRWKLGIGGWGSYRLIDRIVENLVVLDPTATFPDGARWREIARGDSLATGRLRYGLTVSVGPALFPGSALAIDPVLFGRFDLSGAGLGLRVLSVGAGVSFRGGVGQRSVSPPPVLPSIPPAAPSIAASSDSALDHGASLSAAIDLFAVDAGGARAQSATVRTRLVHHLLSMSIPLVLYFDAGSATIPARYRRAKRAEASTDLDSARVRTYQGAYYAMLDLVGLRLRRDPASRCMLWPVGSAEEPRHLAGARIDSIRRYLHEIWGIDGDRIGSGAAEPGGAAPGVLIAVGPRDVPGAINLMIAFDDLLQEYETPRLDMEPTIDAEVGVRRWHVLVKQGDSVLARSGSDGAARERLVIPVMTGRATPPVIAEIEAEDSTGAVAVARDTLPIVIDRASVPRIEEISARLLAELPLRQEWIVQESEIDGPGASTTSDDPIDAIAEKIRTEDRVKVAGVAARHLVRRLRAALERRSLGAVTIEIDERPAFVPSYPDAPESRFLSRAASVVLER